MRAITIVTIAILGTACSALSSGLPPHVAILQANQVSEVLRQCSRPTPSGVSGGWELSSKMALQIEADLPQLATRMHGIDLRVSYRQYIGIVQSGKILCTSMPSHFTSQKSSTVLGEPSRLWPVTVGVRTGAPYTIQLPTNFRMSCSMVSRSARITRTYLKFA